MALSKENTMAKNAHLVLDERATIEVRLRERASFTEIGRELGKALLLSQKKSDSIVRLYVKIPSIPAASEVPVMNTEQHVQSANYSIQKAARDVLV